MQTRRLSPDSLWIEMPLSLQTPRLLWRALSSVGLQKGAINSWEAHHFSSLYEWRPHIVEGRTPGGLFARHNARVQVQLSSTEGGTRLDFDAVYPQPDAIDFGAARRYGRTLVPRIEEFLRAQSADWAEENLPPASVAPIASPFDFAAKNICSQPELRPDLLPLRPKPVPLRERLAGWVRWTKEAVADFRRQSPRRRLKRVARKVGSLGLVWLAWHFGGMGFLLLLGAAQMAWDARKTKRLDVVWFVGVLVLGIALSWNVVRSWF